MNAAHTTGFRLLLTCCLSTLVVLTPVDGAFAPAREVHGAQAGSFLVPVTTELVATADTMINRGPHSSGDYNWGAWDSMRVGYDYYFGLGARRSLVRFDLAGIPPGAIVHEAHLRLYCYSATVWGYEMVITAHRITGDWSEMAATWDNTADKLGEGYGSVTVPDGLSQPTNWYNWDVTALVQSWLDATKRNYGIMLKGYEGPNDAMRSFSVRTDAVSTHWPRLYVTWSEGPTVTPTSTRTPTQTATATRTLTPTRSATPSRTCTATASLTVTLTPVASPTLPATQTATPSTTSTSTQTATASPTSTSAWLGIFLPCIVRVSD